MEKIDPNRNNAIIAAYRMVKSAKVTEGQIRDKLERQGFDREAVDAAVQFAKNNGYVNDECYADEIIKKLANEKLYGPVRIPIELVRRGFPEKLIAEIKEEKIINAETIPGYGVDYAANCAALIKKRGWDMTVKPREALYRYGYDDGIIDRAMALV